MTEQLQLGDIEAGRVARDEAMQRADEHADDAWKDTAWRILVERIGPGEFTTDRVWHHLDAEGAATHEPRALGPVMRRAADAGLIYNTGRVVKSARPECHTRPVTVWLRLAPAGEAA